MSDGDENAEESIFHFWTAAIALVLCFLGAIFLGHLPFITLVFGVGIALTGLVKIWRPGPLRISRPRIPMGHFDKLFWIVTGGMIVCLGLAAVGGYLGHG